MALIDDRLSAMQADLEPSVAKLRIEESVLTTGDSPIDTGLALFMKESRVYYVLQEVERLDRELRRAARALREGRTLPLASALAESLVELPPKTQRDHLRHSRNDFGVDLPTASSLRLVDAAPGSTDLFLVPLGALATVFTSAPLTAVANALAWSGPVGWVRSWNRARHDSLENVSAREAFDIIREAGRDPANLLGQPSAEVILPDGTAVRGNRVVVVRKHADGSCDIIEAGG